MIKFRDFIKDKTGSYDLESDFIIINKGKAFRYFYEYVSEITDYETIGSGRDFAATALYFGKTTHEAVKVACDLTIYCGEPVITYEFKII